MGTGVSAPIRSVGTDARRVVERPLPAGPEHPREEYGFVSEKHAVEERVIEADPHALEFPLHFREHVLGVLTVEKIPKDLVLGIPNPACEDGPYPFRGCPTPNFR
jgi:hypothetical protein